jgi:hypothetical protein
MKIKCFILVYVICGICGCGIYNKETSAGGKAMSRERDGVVIKMNEGRLRLQVFSPWVIRVVYDNNEAIAKTKSFAVIGKPMKTGWKVVEDSNGVSLITDKIEARVNKVSGVVGFYDKNGQAILVEQAGRDYRIKILNCQAMRQFTDWVSIPTA